jgi:hypothetical protein
MKYYFPQNIFSALILEFLPDELKNKIEFLPSASISSAVKEDANSAGLIPATDILTHKDFFVSSSFGISFEEELCNSFFYFAPDQKRVTDLYLYGDISSFEVILCKILFKEFYNSDVVVHLTESLSDDRKSYLVAGDNNLSDSKLMQGVSLSSYFIELLSLPFVNYILSSTNESVLENFVKKLPGEEENLYQKIPQVSQKYSLSNDFEKFISNGLMTAIFKFQQQDRDGLQQILQLPYYLGIIEEIAEIKFV